MSRPDIEAIRARAEDVFADMTPLARTSPRAYQDIKALFAVLAEYVAELEEIARAVVALDTAYAERPKPLWFGSLDPIIDHARALLGE